jgi:glycosyltransferase involved in cell wall biosynthesis
MKKVKISACLITKNEEQLLENCLNSLVGVVDEIIVLDTGSTDRTKEIIQGFNSPPKSPSLGKRGGLEESGSPSLKLEKGPGDEFIRLYETTWHNDFASARNECISYASGDWILSIDADESLSEQTRQRLPVFLAQQPLDQPLAFELKIIAPVPVNDYLFAAPHYKGVLFRNKAGIHFQRAIHERLTGENMITARCPFLELYHHEFLKPMEVLQKKQEAYIKNIENQIKDTGDPEEKCLLWIHLAQSYVLSGDSKNALRTFFLAYQAHSASELNKKTEMYQAVLEGICNELIFRQEDFLRSLKYINELLALFPDSANGYYLLGYSQHFTGLFNDAVFSLEKALNLAKDLPEYERDNTILVNIMCELARCRINQGNDSDGLTLLSGALKIIPEYYRALLYLEKYFLMRGDLPAAVFYHLQNDLNYTEEQKALFKQAGTLPVNSTDYQSLLRQMLSQIAKLSGWTDREKDEMEDMLV